MIYRKIAGLCALPLLMSMPASAQNDPNLAMNQPDELAWTLFIQVNTAAQSPQGGNNAVFETWASDIDTFAPNPKFPTTAAPLALRPPVLPRLQRRMLQQSGGLLPAVPPNPAASLEETRRNEAAFHFIVQNNLYKVSGIMAAFGKTLSFPTDALEVKANWVAVNDIPTFTNGRVTDVSQVPKLYHVNTGSDGVQYALVAMHVISKLVPNWTWATFEHQYNPQRCDIIGCKDSFGAEQPLVKPNGTTNQGYPDCTKTAALNQLFAKATWDPAFANYCLKGSQADFIDNTGLDIRLGNSVTENGFVNQASCMTCHGRASFNTQGQDASPDGGGFDNNGAPLGPINPAWYWAFSSQPPIFEGMPGLQQIATSSDFVWSIPFCAINDLANPPQTETLCQK